jgi:hypothetical protein
VAPCIFAAHAQCYPPGHGDRHSANSNASANRAAMSVHAPLMVSQMPLVMCVHTFRLGSASARAASAVITPLLLSCVAAVQGGAPQALMPLTSS